MLCDVPRLCAFLRWPSSTHSKRPNQFLRPAFFGHKKSPAEAGLVCRVLLYCTTSLYVVASAGVASRTRRGHAPLMLTHKATTFSASWQKKYCRSIVLGGALKLNVCSCMIFLTFKVRKRTVRNHRAYLALTCLWLFLRLLSSSPRSCRGT